jgi:hypothetical protein
MRFVVVIDFERDVSFFFLKLFVGLFSPKRGLSWRRTTARSYCCTRRRRTSLNKLSRMMTLNKNLW